MSYEKMGFKNKVVVITGASSGIGAAAAISFSGEGAQVVMVGRDEAKLSAVAKRCNKPLVIKADVTKEEDAIRIIDETIQNFGQLDVLINNAGKSSPEGSLFNKNTLKCFDELITLNLRAVVHLTSLAAPHLVKTKGNVINVSSAAGKLPPLGPGSIHYSVSKAALNHFTFCAAAELGALGVRINTVSPGPVRTDFITNSKYSSLTWEECTNLTILNRVPEPQEVADLMLFLAGDKAASITGSNYATDNGALSKR